MIVGIVGIPGELSPFCQQVDGIVAQSAGPGAHLTRARWAGHDMILAACGVGKMNAALATVALIAAFHPGVILNCGSAGALSPDLRVGDVVIAEHVVAHDAGVYLDDRFVPTGLLLPPGGPRRRRRLTVDAAWLARATVAAGALGWTAPEASPRSVVGTVATGDQVIFSHAHKARIAQETGALAVEQEGVAVAYTAHLHGVPWLVVRGISDRADGEAAFDYTRWIVYADDPARLGALGQRWFRFTRQLSHPRALMRAHRFRRGVRLATDHVAQLVCQMLRSWAG
jgi:adenosylhomocysteine nucleosidase